MFAAPFDPARLELEGTPVAIDQLSPADIRGTSRRSSESDQVGVAEPANPNVGARAARRQASSPEPANSFPADRSDPLAAYRLNTSTGTPTYSYGGPPASGAGPAPPRTFSYGGAGLISNDTRPAGPASATPIRR